MLEGDEGHGPQRIVITAIGESKVLARYVTDAEWETTWSLDCRCWGTP